MSSVGKDLLFLERGVELLAGTWELYLARSEHWGGNIILERPLAQWACTHVLVAGEVQSESIA